MHPLLWWTLYTLAGIWAQLALPGVDVFAPGLVVCLQERRLSHLPWLLAAWILLQEGMGSAAFGTMILWYAGIIIFFVVGRWLFESRNVLFIFIIGIFSGAWHYGLIRGMGALQGLTPDLDRLAWEATQQAVVFPLVWGLTSNLFRRQVRDDNVL